MDKEKPLIKQLDITLFFILFLLAVFSIIAIYQATYTQYGLYFVKRQIVWYGLGVFVVIGSLLFDFKRLKALAWPIYGIGILLLLLVFLFGEIRNGAQRWIGFGNFLLQPSELMKIFLVITIAHLLAKKDELKLKTTLSNHLKLTLKIGVLTLIPFGFIVIQPDLGTALVLLGVAGIMLVVAGIQWRIILSLILLAVSGIVFLVVLYFVNFDLFQMLIQEHQLERIYGWLAPELYSSGYGFQLLQALVAVGSGQLFGKSVDQGLQIQQSSYIPEDHTDFIFSVIGEGFGFIGGSLLISLFFILVYRLIQIALNCDDPFGTYFVSGVIGMIVLQVFQHIGMNIGLVPITGLALPLISYGGSALLTNLVAIGLALNISFRTREYMFD